MSYDTAKRDRIIQLRAEIRDLQAKEETLLLELQEGCTHESVLTVESRGSLPFQRMCVICGLEEMGLTPTIGSKLVASPVRTVSRDDLVHYRNLPPLTMVPIPEVPV